MTEAQIKTLKDKGLKNTPRRSAVIGLFVKAGRRMGPLEVHRRISGQVPTLGLPTVYRILEELYEAGILLRVTADDRRLYYTLNAGVNEHRHYFVCRRCKRVEEVTGCRFAEVSRDIEKKLGCRVEGHLFQLEGLCARCL